MSNDMEVNGICHCGAIKITAKIKKSDVRACHCTDCQKMSGAPLRVIAPALDSNVKIIGNPNEYIKIGESGNKRIQAFCGKCGTQLFATDLNKTVFNLRAGFLEQKNLLKPMQHVFTKSSVPWLKKNQKNY